MSSKKNYNYRSIPFTSGINSQADFYTYDGITSLLVKCEENKHKIINCRTIGILESINGCFYLKEMNFKSDGPAIKISMDYVKSSLPSTIIPYVVQVFGTLQWQGIPVIHAKIIQPLNTAAGIRLNDALKSVASKHLANPLIES